MARSAKPAPAAAAKPRPKRAAQPPARKGGGETPWLEWVAAGLGLVLILFVLGVIGREVLKGGGRPPAIALQVAKVSEVGDAYVVDVVAQNLGDETAAEVVIEGELVAGREPQTREATLDYLPAGSERRAALVFSADPRTSGLKLRARSFVEP